METEKLQKKLQSGDRRVVVEVAEWRQKSCSGSCRVETEELQWKLQSGDRRVAVEVSVWRQKRCT